VLFELSSAEWVEPDLSSPFGRFDLDGMGCAGVRLKTVTASLHSVVRLQRMRRSNVFVSTRRRSKVCDGRVDDRGARVIFARASSVKSLTVRHKLDLGAVVAVCWKCDSDLGLARVHSARNFRLAQPLPFSV